MVNPETIDTIEEILEYIQEVKFKAGNLSVQSDKVNGGQVYYVVLTLSDSEGEYSQRVATVYPSTTNPPSYNAEFAAEMFSTMGDLVPELSESVLDILDDEEQSSRTVSVASFLADQIYSLTMSITNGNEKLAKAWKPLLELFNIEPETFKELIPLRTTQTSKAVQAPTELERPKDEPASAIKDKETHVETTQQEPVGATVAEAQETVDG